MLGRVIVTLCLLVFATVAAAEDFKVSDIRIEGNHRIETSSVLAVVSIKPGDQVALDDIDQALHSIFALGRFEDISAELTEVQGAKILTFMVRELPLLRKIEFSGNNEFSRQKLRPLVRMRTPSIYSRAKVKESIQEIKNAYIKDG